MSSRASKLLRRVAIVVGLLLLGGVGIGLLYLGYLQHVVSFPATPDTQRTMAALAVPVRQQPYTVLIAGIDSQNRSGPCVTDNLVVARVDPQLKRVWLLAIPRDAAASIPGHGEVAIGTAHLLGGPAGTIDAVKSLTGLKVNYYAEVDFEGLGKAADVIGGVWLNVPSAITGTGTAPATKAASLVRGYQLLDGAHALTLLRGQSNLADQDLARLQGQQLFLTAFGARLAQNGSFAKETRVVSAVAPSVKSTMTLAGMGRLATVFRNAGSGNVYWATATGPMKSGLIRLDPALLIALVADMKNNRPFDESKVAADMATASGAASTAATRPSRITITVHNGSGLSGAARQAASVLQAQGFKIVGTGNANQNVYSKTFVIYKSDVAGANLVTRFLPPGAKAVPSNGMYAFGSDLLVIIGKDWDVAKIPAAPIMTQ